MLDATLVREGFEALRERLGTRGAGLDPLLDRLAALEADRRRIIPQVETLKRERNEAGEQVARLKREGGDAAPLLEANKARAEQIKRLDADLQQIEDARRDVLLRVPNVPHASVPVGSSAVD